MTATFTDLDDLKHKLETKFNGVITLPMWVVRDAYGAERLGVNVVANIAEGLEARGIGHLPKSLPRDQWEMARFYLKGTAVGRVIKAALAIDEDQDDTLRKLTNEKADEVLRRVRELVCD